MCMNKPELCVWEVTQGCNLRCKHCGSTCENPLADELNTEEMLDVCRQLSELGVGSVTLTGGEPTTRKDICKVIKELHQREIIVNIITNGWSVNASLLDEIKESGIGTFAVSVDGLESTHDTIRKKGAFEKAINLLKSSVHKGVYTAAITTLNSINIEELEGLYEVFSDIGINAWQIQFAIPMGTMSKNKDKMILPTQVSEALNFIADKNSLGKMYINPGDCLGYYTDVKDGGNGVWNGCTAGKRSFGIMCNGDVIGCTSLRDDFFIEDNIRKTSLKEIWDNPQSFAWNRTLEKNMLEGNCKKCAYGELCKGGCTCVRFFTKGSIYSENEFCSYYQAIEECSQAIDEEDDIEELQELLEQLISEKYFQQAQVVLEKILTISQSVENYMLAGYVNYMLHNFELSLEYNENGLKLEKENYQCKKGKVLCLCKIDPDKGIPLMEELICENEVDIELYYDFICILLENQLGEEADYYLSMALGKDPAFLDKYRQLAQVMSVEERAFKESRYNVTVECQGKQFLYNCLTNQLMESGEKIDFILGTAREFQKVYEMKSNKDSIELLEEGGFLLSLDSDELSFIEVKSNMDKYSSNKFRLTIAPTIECNFNCIYCYENKVGGIITKEVAENIRKEIEKRAKERKDISITWYGGEPLLCMDFIEEFSEELISICEENQVQYSASMVTNGYLISEEMIQRIKKSQIRSLQITLDGPEDIHDKRRKLKNSNEGTFDKILKAIQLLHDAKINVKIRINVDSANNSYIEELLDILKKDNLQDFIVELGYVKSCTEFCQNIKNECLSVEEYAKISITFWKMLLDKEFYRSLENAFPFAQFNYCGAVSLCNYVVDPNGELFKCWHEIGLSEYSVGNISDINHCTTKNSNNYLRYLKWSPLKFDKCRECKVLPICVGGCPNVNLLNNAEPECERIKFVLEDLLEIYCEYRMKIDDMD